MQNTDNITGKVIGVSKTSGSYDVSLKTGIGVVKVKLSSATMGLGSVDERGKTGSIIRTRNSDGSWIPTSLVNPNKIVGRKVDVFGTPLNGKDSYIDRPKAFRIR